jgi:hypothetical protein
LQPRDALAVVVILALAETLAPAVPEEPPATPPAGMSFPAGPPATPPPLPGGSAPDLNLVVTANVAGWIEPCG